MGAFGCMGGILNENLFSLIAKLNLSRAADA